MRPLFLAFFVMSFVSAACSGSSQDREARLFLERIEGISVEAPIDVRGPKIEELERMPLADASLVSLRDACVRAHRMLLRAEQGQENARLLLSTASAERGTLDADTSRRISQAIAQSTDDVDESRRLFVSCDGPVRELASRFGARR
jgi:hypothetical protein